MKKLFYVFICTVICVFAFAESRNALLIANGKYVSFSSLKNPVPEAKELKVSLEKIGFEVTIIENASREQMMLGLSKFQKKLKVDGGIAFFHYGGHAVQVNGKNFLIPVDADIPDEELVEFRAVNLDEIMTNMKGDSNIVVLDACRNNPLPAGSGRSATRGLQLCSNRPQKSIVIYSAEPGNVAQDGVFTPILTKKILEKKSFSDILSEVSMEVYERTEGKQSPGSYTQLFPTTYLAGVSTETPVIVHSENASKPKAQPQQKKSAENSLDSVFASANVSRQYIEKNNAQTANQNRGRSNAEAQKMAKQVAVKDYKVEKDATGNLIIDDIRFLNTSETKALSKVTKIVGNNADGVFIKRRTVTLSPFYISKYEVTQQLFDFVMGANPSKCKDSDSNYRLASMENDELRPVESINWYQAITFCNKLSIIMGYTPCYSVAGIKDWESLSFKEIPTGANSAWDNVICNFDANGYRLPTEAEWEYAANDGSVQKFAGSNNITAYGWYTGNSRAKGGNGTHQVGLKSPNKNHLYDMTGNVAEWCWDLFGLINEGVEADPIGASYGSGRMVKGGSWDEPESKCLVQYRGYYGPQYTASFCGMRTVRSTK